MSDTPPIPEFGTLTREWQNFFMSLVQKGGDLTQLTGRSHADLQGLDADDHSIYLKGLAGIGTFNSTEGVQINVDGTLSTDDYKVFVQPTVEDPSNIGVIGIIDKTVGGFTVVNSGSDDSSSFDWILVMR